MCIGIAGQAFCNMLIRMKKVNLLQVIEHQLTFSSNAKDFNRLKLCNLKIFLEGKNL